MGEAWLTAEDGRLAADLAASLEPKFQDALNHPTRRAILRALHDEARSRSVSEILADLTPLKRSEVCYHARVLRDSGCIEIEGSLAAAGNGEQLYSSVVGESEQALLVLRATQQVDRAHRQRAAESESPGILTMFRVPRPALTVRLLGRRLRESDQNR